jgi:hypothetical protein
MNISARTIAYEPQPSTCRIDFRAGSCQRTLIHQLLYTPRDLCPTPCARIATEAKLDLHLPSLGRKSLFFSLGLILGHLASEK